MVGLVVAMLLAAVGVSSMSKFAARDRVLSAKNEIVSGIKMARNYAMSTQKPLGYANQLDSVAVTLTVNGIMTIQPVTKGVGIGASYMSKDISDNEVEVTPVTMGELVYSVPEGKLLDFVGGNPVNATNPRSETYVVRIGVSATDVNIGGTRAVTIYSWGTFDEK